MAYTEVHVFGDSLVDGGNVLKLAELVDSLPFGAIPDGAPTADKGYFLGRFTDGFTFADLVSNKFLSVVTEPVFPFGFRLFGISNPFLPDPEGNNLNFAYGGASIRQGDELVPDLDDQTDAYRDAVDRRIDPHALHIVTIGGNDVRGLVPAQGAVADPATALARLADAAEELQEEISQLIEIGARNFLITGIPDVGIIPRYNGVSEEAARREAATNYSALLDGLIQTRLGELRASFPAADLNYVSLLEATGDIASTLADLYGPGEVFPLNESERFFFDEVHPTAQVHTLLGGIVLDTLNETVAGEAGPTAAPDFKVDADIATGGESDGLVFSLAAGASYTFELLGLSSGAGSLADPLLSVLGPGGLAIGADDDGGLGLDASFEASVSQAGDYLLKLTGVGSLFGSYRFQASGNAPGNDTYLVTTAAARILERAGEGSDTVLASVNYALGAGVSVEKLMTDPAAGAAGLSLTGNELGQTIIGDGGANVLVGGGGNDTLDGGPGADGIDGGDGDDVILQSASAGLDTTEGGAGRDLLRLTTRGQQLVWSGITGVEAVTGAQARIVGTAGSDLLDFSAIKLTGIRKIDAGGGADVVIGSSGADVIGLSAGKDTLSGGLGPDVFDMDAISESAAGALADLIIDFQHGVDKISLKDVDASTVRSGNQAFAFIGTLSFSGVAGQLRVDYPDASSTSVLGDVNGDGVADFQINLATYVVLQSSDFTL